MLDAVERQLPGTEVFVSVAAVADYTPARPAREKIKKNDQSLSVDLHPTVDILARVAARADAPFCVGFAAESEQLLEHARSKRLRKRVPLIVANLASTALAADDNEVW